MAENFVYPKISIAIVNLNGKSYLKDCLGSLKQLDYPAEKVEIIVVDNNSSDGSAGFLSSNYPEVKVIKNRKNVGFARANNQAAEIASGEYIAFLNNDTKVDKKWLIELLRPVYRDPEVVCSGSKVLSFDGKSIDFAGGMINFEGKGFQIDYGVPVDEDKKDSDRYIPFVNGGAMLVKRDVFLEAGGFDGDFFAYYEDVDFGWRLWVLGFKVVYAPKSIVYHVHHGTSKIFSEDKLRFLKERNSLYSVIKNYGDENLSKALAATLGSVFNRLFVDIKFDWKDYYSFEIIDPEKSSKLAEKLKSQIENIRISPEPLSSVMAVKDLFENLPKLLEKREWIQKNRGRDDKAVFTYFRGQFLAVSPDKDYQQNQINILKSTGIYDVFSKQIKRKLLIVTSEVVSGEMAGPAIRVWNFAQVLSRYMDVKLAVPNKVELAPQPFEIVHYTDNSSLRPIIEDSDIILTGGTTFGRYDCIKKSGKYLVMDIYDPYNLAALAEYKDESFDRRLSVHKLVHYNLNEQFYHGDFFICASERQRDFWLGMLAALNRINPYTYNQDPTLKKMISVVPFGLPSNKPMHTGDVLKGKIDGIGKDDFVIIWGGGIYNWFDPLTLVRAMEKIGKDRDDIKLFFMGIKHPNPEVREMQLASETVNLAKKLGVYGKNVFFNFGWVPYEDRQNYLLESDVGIITHPEQIETRFSFRTRMLDYFWAGLPIISTEGDSLSELIIKNNLGLVVKAGDADNLADAILRMADDNKLYKRCRENIEKMAQNYHWEDICKPLIDFCRDPVTSAVRKRVTDTNEEINKISRDNRPRKGKLYLAGRFFYHFIRSPRSSFRYISNYMRGA